MWRITAGLSGNGWQVPVPEESLDAARPDGVQVEEFETGDPESAHAALSERYAQHQAVVDGSTENFRFRLRGASAGPCGWTRCTTRCAPAGRPRRSALFFVSVERGVQLLRSGRDDVRVGPGTRRCTGSAGRSPEVGTTSSGDAVLAVRPGGAAGERADRGGRRRRPEVRGLRAGVVGDDALLARHPGLRRGELRRPTPCANPLLQVETTNCSYRGAVDVPSTAMRAAGWAARLVSSGTARAVAYIEAHADQPMTLTDIAARQGLRPARCSTVSPRHDTTTSYLRRAARAHAERAPTAARQRAAVGFEAGCRRTPPEPGRLRRPC